MPRNVGAVLTLSASGGDCAAVLVAEDSDRTKTAFGVVARDRATSGRAASQVAQGPAWCHSIDFACIVQPACDTLPFLWWRGSQSGGARVSGTLRRLTFSFLICYNRSLCQIDMN